MVSSNLSPRILCCNREYCLCWEMDFNSHFANAFTWCGGKCWIPHAVEIHSNVAVFLIFGTQATMFCLFLCRVTLYQINTGISSVLPFLGLCGKNIKCICPILSCGFRKSFFFFFQVTSIVFILSFPWSQPILLLLSCMSYILKGVGVWTSIYKTYWVEFALGTLLATCVKLHIFL